MKVLAMVTSGRVGSAALLCSDDDVDERVFEPARGHGGRLLPEIHALLSDKDMTIRDVDLFATCAGPGSFTGLRIGLATAKALAWATETPVTAVNTLHVLAQNDLAEPGFVSPILDARRGEVYGGLYESTGSGVEQVIAAEVMHPELWIERVQSIAGDQNVRFLGSGVSAYPDVFGTQEVLHRVSAVHLAYLARTSYPDKLTPAQPLYIRPSQAEVNFGDAPEHDPLAGLD